ncbi:pre-peptidase C-terminal domain-containing protein [Anabaena sp. CCY 9910]|uniref:PPC domain-containing protein n=1 Tax=Anabaena sp. CCY 9910 TaxID=3103870 RepID=UPI0039E19A9B
MAEQKNKNYWLKFNLALIVSMSSSLVVANYTLPIKALDIHENSGKLIIAKTPDERQPEAVQQAIEQIPTSPPPATPQQSKQSIESPIPVRESSNSTASNPTPQPRESNSANRTSTPSNSNPTSQPRQTNSAPRTSTQSNSNSRQTNSASPQRGRQSATNPGSRNSTAKISPVSLSNLPFREINFVDIAFGVLSKGDFQSQGRYFHFYKFEGRENQLLQIRLGGSTDSRRSSNLSLSPFMFLLDPDNKVILKRGSVGTNSDLQDAFVFVRLPVKGTYTIVVTSRNPGDTGRYSLALRNDRASYILDESAELNAQSSTIKQNRSAYNVSQFQGKKNQLVSIRADSVNEEFSPYIVLLNSQGKTIAADNAKDGLYSALIDRARLPEDDTYYIVVTSNNPNNRGTYRLTLF